MHVQTKFLRLRKPVSLGDHIDNWRVCWLGGWDKCRVFFVVMVERGHEQPVQLPDPRTQWKHHGIHNERGAETVETIVRMFAGHDLNHFQQIERILAAKKK
jgi:hypothetical protein